MRIAPWAALAALAGARVFRRRGPADAIPPPETPQQIDAREPGRGRLADAPWEIPALGWKDILWRTWRKVGRNRLPALSGGITFYLLLATFPAIAAFVSIYGLFLNVDTVERTLDQMAAVLPRDAVSLIGGQMQRLAAQRPELLSATFLAYTLVSIWSANAGMKALFDGLNVAYDEAEKRPYLRRSLITYGATLAGILFITGVTVLTVAAPMTLHSLGLHRIRLWWAPLRWLVVYGLAAGAFTLIYRFGPSRAAPRWRWVFCGGAAAALAWLAGSLVFSWYINNFTHFGVTYGSLGAMIAYMLWIWFSMMVVLIGAELNAEIEHQTARDTTQGPERPMGERRAAMADTVGKAFTVSPGEAGHLAGDFLGRQAASVVVFLRRLTS